jgi:hypothetical protein
MQQKLNGFDLIVIIIYMQDMKKLFKQLLKNMVLINIGRINLIHKSMNIFLVLS